MGSQRNQRLNMLQLLHVSVLWFYLLPSLLCYNLPCYYSPILENKWKFELIETECPPDEVCFKGNGCYGNHSALSLRGCMAEKNCSQVDSLQVRGTTYDMSYTCCDRPYCNSCQSVTAKLSITVTLVTVAVIAGL
ncbi:protein Bouncer [Scomber scombrus]|uniref:Protein Bouncer n=1 Tax=Scomber scombrus TaxID=13677 RepID=A0AAV1NR05_SCOSC